MNRYVFEFEGTVTPKEGDPFKDNFYVVAVDVVEGKQLLDKANPKVSDLIYTGTKHLCNKDWDVR